VSQAFVGFPSASERLHSRSITVTGTPVRADMHVRDPETCRAALGLNPMRPVVLVMGGSQGATAINDLVVQSLPVFARTNPEWQWIHLTGTPDCDRIKPVYSSLNLNAVVRPFLAEMDLALGAATAAISRAGASSLAELAAMRVPALLVPYPAAVDNHQFFNARAFEQSGAACVLVQQNARAEALEPKLREIVTGAGVRQKMQQALAAWDAPTAADQIANAILKAVGIDVQQVNRAAIDKQNSRTSGDLIHCSAHQDGCRLGTLRVSLTRGGAAWM